VFLTQGNDKKTNLGILSETAWLYCSH